MILPTFFYSKLNLFYLLSIWRPWKNIVPHFGGQNSNIIQHFLLSTLHEGPLTGYIELERLVQFVA